MYISLWFCKKYAHVDFLKLALDNGVDSQEGLNFWSEKDRLKDPSGIYKVGRQYIDRDKVMALTDSLLFNALPKNGIEDKVLSLSCLRGREYREALEKLWIDLIESGFALPLINFEQRIKNARARDRALKAEIKLKKLNKKPCKAGG